VQVSQERLGLLGRRLTKQQFVDRTIARWLRTDGIGRRVTKRDAELVAFVYEELRSENYNNAFPDAFPEEPIKKEG
jgi:hypothetical protein